VNANRILKALLVLTLSGPLSASGWLSLYHLIQATEESTGPDRPADIENCQPGEGYGIVADHSGPPSPVHFCAVCVLGKGQKGIARAASQLTAPPLSPDATLSLARGEKPRYPGFSRVSRSPPA
jgi:hypothetical protein